MFQDSRRRREEEEEEGKKINTEAEDRWCKRKKTGGKESKRVSG